jgi:hypothetical protein
VKSWEKKIYKAIKALKVMEAYKVAGPFFSKHLIDLSAKIKMNRKERFGDNISDTSYGSTFTGGPMLSSQAMSDLATRINREKAEH